MLKNPGLAASVVHSAAKVTFTFISLIIRGWKYMIHFMSFHVFSTARYLLLACCALRLVRFPGKPEVFRFFLTGHVVHSSAKIMFTFKIWFISYDKIFNFKHWTNVTPVGLHPRKKLQKRGCATFPANFLKLLVKAVILLSFFSNRRK